MIRRALLAGLLALSFAQLARAEEQPPYESKDAGTAENFRTAYYAIDKLSLLSTLFSYTLDSATNQLCIDSPSLCVNALTHTVTQTTTTFSGAPTIPAGSAASPGLVISGSPTTGLASLTANTLSQIANGTEATRAQATTFKVFLPLSEADGSVSTPAYGFDVDSNTGFYRVGNDIAAVATGGVERWEIGNSSTTVFLQMLRPNQPSFLVTNSAGATDVTGDGTAYTVVWGNEITDRAGNFASNTFTAPVTGDYILTASVFLRQLTAAHTPVVIAIVTSNREYRSSYLLSGLSFNSLPVHAAVADADMDANDTATVVITVSGSTKVIDVDNDAKQNYFSGSLNN